MAEMLVSLLDLQTDTGCIAEYVWIDGHQKVRGKARHLNFIPEKPSDLPKWNYDGSSTAQATGENSEVILVPQAIFSDPFRKKPNILVMCDTYTAQGEPHQTNSRFECKRIMEKASELEPWFGLEQEYFLQNPDTGRPIGFPTHGDPEPQGPYYCGISGSKMHGRDISDAHFKACVYAGIKIAGTNAEVAPGQWEFQVGPAVGIEEGDHLWMARYILQRIAELKGLDVNYDPKPIKGDWNGSGCHANFSTKPMREDGGYEKYIIPAMAKLKAKHKQHIAAYGLGNEERLTGKHETASIDSFDWGVANRGASIRVGRDTEQNGKGYFEDRRPAGNCDPYVVTKMLVETCCREH
ncbi:unnamed protein product [Agarophyton chilense]